jgi:hypothetical protein
MVTPQQKRSRLNGFTAWPVAVAKASNDLLRHELLQLDLRVLMSVRVGKDRGKVRPRFSAAQATTRTISMRGLGGSMPKR